jgi:hypothetical protein
MSSTPFRLLSYLFLSAGLFAQDGPEPSRPEFQEQKPNADAILPDPAAAMKRMKQVAPDTFELGLLQFNSKTREIRIPGVVNMADGLIEYLMVHETGKTHEALLRSNASPLDLQVAMLLCNYQPGHTGLFPHVKDPAQLKRSEPTAPKTPGANNVQLEVEWKVKDAVKRVPVAQWLREAPHKTAPKSFDHWIFNGSMIQASGFSAELYGSLVGLYYDVTAVINCPTALNGQDDVWSPNTSLMPAAESPVTLVITPFAPKP